MVAKNKKINPVSPIMTEAEIKEFIKSLLMDADYHHYALDGFLFLFKTFSEMAEQNAINLIDFLADMQRFVYVETVHCNLSQDKYQASIGERYRSTDYTEKNVNIYQAMKKEVGCEETILDLSNSSGQGLKLSEVKHG